jgi:tetratricopeptide (TPR) repeat protein
MPKVLPQIEQELKETWERLERASAEKHAAALEKLSPSLATHIKQRTVIPDEIDAFLAKSLQIQPDLKEYLLSKKAGVLFHQGSEDEALKYYDAALDTKETPSTWTAKGIVLFNMRRIDEALQAFQKAYSLREDFGTRKQEYLQGLFLVWSNNAYLLAIDGSLYQDSKKFNKGVYALLDIWEKAKSEGMENILSELVFGEPASHAPEEVQEAREEVRLAIELLSIKDPFDRWRAFTKEISKVWPKDISAVEAIREQREREWNNW